MPSEEALRTGLGLGPQDSPPGGDPENLVINATKPKGTKLKDEKNLFLGAGSAER